MTVITDLRAEDYHDDPCEQPSLSRTIANLLVTSSPKHAWTAHPRLNPDFKRHEDEKFDVGTAAHALLFDGAAGVVVVDAADWRTKAAKDERDAARAAGLVPMLEAQWLQTQEMVAATREQLAGVEAEPPLFSDGMSEQTLVWEEAGGVTCRARLDWLRDDRRAIDDFKTTSRSANPDSWSRSLFGMGYDVQAAFYLRGLDRILNDRVVREFRFVVQETFPPYALSVIALGPDVLTIAHKKVEYAIDLWRECLRTGLWPAYPNRVCWAELPAWEEARWLEKELRDAA